VSAISVFGIQGDLLASSRFFPAPTTSVPERDDFQAARRLRPAAYISLPARGGVLSDVFTTNVARVSPTGKFMGVVSIALRRPYFSDFYRELADTDASQVIGLFKPDGGILVRFPDTRPDVVTASNKTVDAAIAVNRRAGHLPYTSTVDGVRRLLSYRRVSGYPLYVTAGVGIDGIYRGWRNNLLALAAIIALPTLSVCFVLLYSLRRLSAEELACERWQSEMSMRLTAEASSRQLRRMGALGNLVANVAHDFNNLLMVVTSNMELARRKSYNGLENEVKAVQRAASGAQGLARRLLSVARKQPLKRELVDVTTWIKAVAGILKTAVGDNISVAVDVEPDVGSVLVDPLELESAALNIAVNAKDAMPQGGEFSIRAQRVFLPDRQHGLDPGEYVMLSFSDNGEGMSPEVQERVFEPLFTTKAEGAGTGLGLAQVLSACEQAGGTASAHSIKGSGATIRLYFPRHAARPIDTSVHEPAVADEPASDGVASVLLVEDNEDVAAGIAAVLEMLGCQVQHELTADRALAVLESESSFGLILSDIQMPGALSGIDLAERVRARWPKQKIALMTGYAGELERANVVGVTILAKPFDIEELQALMRETRSR
jgi:signal transduction histidine kinase